MSRLTRLAILFTLALAVPATASAAPTDQRHAGPDHHGGTAVGIVGPGFQTWGFVGRSPIVVVAPPVLPPPLVVPVSVPVAVPVGPVPVTCWAYPTGVSC